MKHLKVAHLPGRMAGNNPNGSNKRIVYHLVPEYVSDGTFYQALCGIKPKGRSYGWYIEECVEDQEKATCERCIQKSQQQ
jgi:hypothetical protein